MKIMEMMEAAREEMHRKERQLDNIIKGAIDNADLELKPATCITPHYHYDRLKISIHTISSEDEREEIETSIGEIDFFIACDIEMDKVNRIAEVIMGEDEILRANS